LPERGSRERTGLGNDPDTAKIGERIDAFEKTIDEMSKVGGGKPMMWESYERNVDNFRKSAKAL
jgi:hypothetical protein